MNTRIHFFQLVCAQNLATRGTVKWALAPVLFGFGLIALSSSLGLGLGGQDWNGGLLAWFSLLPSLLALPLSTILGVITAQNEHHWRGGGLWWRNIHPRRMTLARLSVHCLWILLALVVLLALSVISGYLRGALPIPWHRLGAFLILMWAAMSAGAAAGELCYRFLGTLALGTAPLGAAVYSIVGATNAERESWQWEPWAWLPRACLPVLGTHANSVPLDADSPIWQWSWQPGVLLLAAMALFFALACWAIVPLHLDYRFGYLSCAIARLRSTARKDSQLGTASTPAASVAVPPPVLVHSKVHATPLRGVGAVMPWGLWAGTIAACWMLLVCIRWVYPDSYAPRFFGLIIIPAFAYFVGVSTWLAIKPGWRGLLMRMSALRLLAYTLTIAFSVSAFGLFSSALVAFWNNSPPAGDPQWPDLSYRGVYTLLVMLPVAWLFLALSFYLSARFSTTVALVFALACTTWGVTIGGDVLARTWLWTTSWWAWADVAGAYPQHWSSIFFLSSCIGWFAAALTWLRAPRCT